MKGDVIRTKDDSMSNKEPNSYDASDNRCKQSGAASGRRTMRSRVTSFFAYSILLFCFTYMVGSSYYIKKLYRERPPGANYMTVGDMAAKEFRTKHPIVLFLMPPIIGGARAIMPR